MKRIFLTLLAVVLLLPSCTNTTGLYPKNGRKTVRIVSYNVGIFGKWDLSSESYTATLMNELGADVIALQELDSCTTRTGPDRFQAKDFASAMGEDWRHFYAAALIPYKEGTYGIGEVWNSDRLDMVKCFKVKLPRVVAREDRALAVVEYENMVVASTHLNGNPDDVNPSVRLINETLKGLYGETDKPVFLCGDFNARPDNPAIEYLRTDWNILTPVGATGVGGKNRDLPAPPQTIEEVKGNCIDYIMLLKNKAEVEVLDSQICFRFETGSPFESSDHLPVFVDVRF